eukprot:1032707-Rhodomonas_salina.2
MTIQAGARKISGYKERKTTPRKRRGECKPEERRSVEEGKLRQTSGNPDCKRPEIAHRTKYITLIIFLPGSLKHQRPQQTTMRLPDPCPGGRPTLAIVIFIACCIL